MVSLIAAFTMVVLVLAPPLTALERAKDTVPFLDEELSDLGRSSGDNPPTMQVLHSGPIGFDYELIGFQDGYGYRDDLVEVDVPEGVSIRAATLLTGVNSHGSHYLGIAIDGERVVSYLWPFTIDQWGDNPYDPLRGYIADLTPFITGSGSYLVGLRFSSPGEAPYSRASILLIIYERADLPTREVEFMLGAELLAGASSTTTFTATPAGQARLHLFVQGGMDEEGDDVLFNGDPVPCCDVITQIYNGQSMEIPVEVESGDNTVTVSVTGVPRIGWLMAALVTEPPPVSVGGAIEGTSWGRLKGLYR